MRLSIAFGVRICSDAGDKRHCADHPRTTVGNLRGLSIKDQRRTRQGLGAAAPPTPATPSSILSSETSNVKGKSTWFFGQALKKILGQESPPPPPTKLVPYTCQRRTAMHANAKSVGYKVWAEAKTRLTLTVPSLVNPIDLLHIYLLMVMTRLTKSLLPQTIHRYSLHYVV